MTANNLHSWYEASLPSSERKMRGHFSTPPQLVEQILDACGYKPENDLSHIRVLDPACGSGNFLIGATRRLIAYEKRIEFLDKEHRALVQRNIWGFDPDPIACFLAEMQLRAVLAESCQAEKISNGLRRSKRAQKLPLHIHQADGLALSWEQSEKVDLFLANPPYLASKNTDLSGYRSAQQRGQSDSYLLFLSLALQIVRPGGWIALVLPDPVLARSNAIKGRQHLLAETTIHHLWHLADVFAAYVGAVVIIAQKHPPPHTHLIAWKREQWQNQLLPQQERAGKMLAQKRLDEPHPDATNFVSQLLLNKQPGAELRYLLSETNGSLAARLHTYKEAHTLLPLKEFATIRRGEELSKDNTLLMQKKPGEEFFYPVLRGGIDVQPYSIPVAQRWIAQDEIKKPLERYLAPKVLVVKSTRQLQAALDLQGHVVLQTLYLLYPCTNQASSKQDSDHDELYFLLALLNSRLLREYVYILYTAYKWVQPQIEQHVLACLPIPTINTVEKRQIIKLAKLLMRACGEDPTVVEWKERSQYIEELERAICALYEIAVS